MKTPLLFSKSLFAIFIILFSSSLLTAQDELLLRFHNGTPQQEIDTMLSEFNATELAVSPVSLIRRWRLDSTVYENGQQKFIVEGDTLTIQESGKKGRQKTKIESAGVNWATSITPPFNENSSQEDCSEEGFSASSCPVIVAVIDTGIDSLHADLQGWFWNNTPETPAEDGLDNDGNNFVDDLLGYDLLHTLAMPIDSHSHGTHIAGTIINLAADAQANNIRTMTLKSQNRSGAGSVFAAIEAIDYARANGANIINMSIGYIDERLVPVNGIAKPAPMELAIIMAQLENILVVSSAGNDSVNIDTSTMGYYPAGFGCHNLITVGAFDCAMGQLYEFSNFGLQSVDLAARGLIHSTIPDNRWAHKKGTSMAAAFVSGTAAILGTYTCPFDYALIKESILNTVDQQGLPVLTGGVINRLAALEYLQTQLPPSKMAAPTIDEVDFNIYPQPFTDHLTVEWKSVQASNGYIRMTDLMGNIIFEEQLASLAGKNQFTWQVDRNLSGFYVLSLTAGGKVKSKKVFAPRL